MNENNSLKALTNPGEADDFFKIDDLPAFNPSVTNTYSRGNALWLMETCRLVYREDELSRRDFFQQNGLEELRFFSTGNTQGALVRGDRFAVLAFRGTLGNQDFLADLDFPPVNWPGEGKVHEGFKKQFDDVWGEVKDGLSRIDVPVFYCGHSLGAALATLAASTRFLEGDPRPAALYTFGSPRVGTTGFMQAFPADFMHFRVVNDRDIVPTVPPPRLIIGTPDFHHVGIPHQIDHEGHLRRGKLNDDEDGLAAPLGHLRERFETLRNNLGEVLRTRGASLLEKFTDHTPVNYTARIERAVELP